MKIVYSKKLMDVVSELPEWARVEHRRRIDTVVGVLYGVRDIWKQQSQIKLEEPLKYRLKSAKMIFITAVLLSIISAFYDSKILLFVYFLITMHYFYRDLDFHYQAHKYQNLKNINDEYLYRWISVGAREDQFDELKELVITGHKHYLADEYEDVDECMKKINALINDVGLYIYESLPLAR